MRRIGSIGVEVTGIVSALRMLWRWTCPKDCAEEDTAGAIRFVCAAKGIEIVCCRRTVL